MSSFNELSSAVDSVAHDYQNGQFHMIMEDDFLARTYYHLLSRGFETLSNRIFIKARILQDNRILAKGKKYDLVVGSHRDYKADRRDIRDVEPQLVTEFKAFPVGFRYQQLRNRRKGIQEDIKKLNLIASATAKGKIEFAVVFFDDIEWMDRKIGKGKNSQLEEAIRFRNKVNKAIHILGIIGGRLINV